MKTRSLQSSITAAIKRCFSLEASLLLLLTGFLQLTAWSQVPGDCKVQCTANDVRVVTAYLVDYNSMQKLPLDYTCTGATADTRIALELTTNTHRIGVSIYAEIVQLKQDGTIDHILQTVSECFFEALQTVQNNKVVFHDKFTWTCGMPIALTNVYIAWGTGQENFCLGSDAFRCPETPSKCYQLPAGQYISIQTPTGQPASAELCSTTPGGNTATFNLTSLESTVTGTQPNVAVAWYTDENLTNPISTPSSYTTGTTTVWAKVYNVQSPTAFVKEPVTLTVNTTPTATSTSSTMCSSTAGGSTAFFNLTALESAVKGGQTSVTVTWYTTNDLTTQITNPGSYTSGSITVYAKVAGEGGCYSIAAIALNVNRKPEVTVASQTLCASTAGGSTAIFDLASLANTVKGGQAGVNVTWYSDEGLLNPITSMNYTSSTTTIWAKVANNADAGCYNNTAVDLTTNYKPTATATSSVACATVTGGSTATFNLASMEATVKGTQAGVSVTWFTTADLNSGSAISDPTSFTTGGGVVYAKVANSTASTCYTATGITLSVKPSYVNNVDTTIWEGDSYMLPTGRVVAAPGSYLDKVTYGNGCDSLVTNLNLNIKRVERPTTGTVLCAGRSYTLPWGQVVTEPGLYVQTLKDVSGHDSIVNTVNLTLQSPTYRTINATICDGKSYSMPGGSTVTRTGTFYEILYYTTGCDSLITTLNLNVQKVIRQTNNVVIPAFSSYTLPSGRIVTVGGNYIDSLYFAATGCDSCIIRTNLAVAGPLPVRFVSISAVKLNGFNKIRWAVANEENTAYYEVERSNDCTHFIAVGKVAFTLTGGQVNNYEFLDNASGTANICYRVKEVDNDGHFEYSEVIFMKYSTTGSLAIFPNPAQGMVTLQFSAERKGMAIIQFIDGNGRIAMEKQVSVDEGNNIIQMDNLSRFAPGAYSVNIRTGSRSLTGRLMIR